MALPPVARISATPGWFIRASVSAIDGCSTHWMQFSGAPAAIAASRTTCGGRAEHCWAPGWNAKMMGLRVFSAIRLLKIAVDVGFVTGVMPQTTPTGSAISTMPEISSLLITPTVLRYCREWVICSETKMFFDGLVLEDAAAGLGDGRLGQLAVLVQGGDGGLLDDEVDLAPG